jgi:hypothetical protein
MQELTFTLDFYWILIFCFVSLIIGVAVLVLGWTLGRWDFKDLSLVPSTAKPKPVKLPPEGGATEDEQDIFDNLMRHRAQEEFRLEDQDGRIDTIPSPPGANWDDRDTF